MEWDIDMGEIEMFGSKHRRIVAKEPAGVVGAIIPWNVPFYITVGKVIPALLAGCTVILKPAPETPLIGAILGELAHDIGFPPGVLNVVSGKDPAMLGEMLATDKRVDLISFTGSTAVGRRIMEAGAPTLKRLFLELGRQVGDDNSRRCARFRPGGRQLDRLLPRRARLRDDYPAAGAAEPLCRGRGGAQGDLRGLCAGLGRSGRTR